jgi:hypothetical protein
LKEPEELLFAASVAVHCTVVGPTGKVLPEVGVHATTGFGSVAEVAVTVKFTTAPEADVAVVVMSAGK